MKTAMRAIIEDEEITVDLVIVQLIRLQQIASGINPITGKMFGHPSRLEALRQELDEIDDQVVLWSRFVPELDALEKMFEGVGIRYGGNDTKRAEA